MEPRVPEKQDAPTSKNSGTTSTNGSLPSLSMRSSSQNICGTVHEPIQIWSIFVCPTTGGSYNYKISSDESVENLKRTVGRSLKLAKERINLLYKER